MQGSRVDPLYGRVVAELVELIPGQTAEIAGTPTVVCWNKEDWLALSDSFRAVGEMEPLEYWFGWTRGNRGVINLSYPACKQLDGIAYLNGQLARQARRGRRHTRPRDDAHRRHRRRRHR